MSLKIFASKIIVRLSRGQWVNEAVVGNLEADQIRHQFITRANAHYSVVTWASGHLKSPATQLFVQQLVRAKKTSRKTILTFEGNPPWWVNLFGSLPQRASNAENICKSGFFHESLISFASAVSIQMGTLIQWTYFVLLGYWWICK